MKTLFLLLFLGLLVYGQQIPLIQNGAPSAEIILPADAIPIETFAAKELQDHIRLISGADCAILTQPSGEKLPVRLGRAAQLDIDGLKKNSARIRIAEDGIDIAGVDGTGKAMDSFTASGTLFGVYDFLEKQLGVRWLWQGELGTTYPKSSSIQVEPKAWETHPLVYSCWRINPTRNAWKDKANYQRYENEARLWLRRHRFALADTLNRGHAWIRWYDRYHTEHPDWFNLLPDGKREPDPLYFDGNKELISMCVTNPGFIQEVFEDWQRNDPNGIINANENDTAGKCTCPDCLASDGLGHDEERLAEARRRFEAYDPLWWQALGSLSDRYCRLYLKLLEMGKKVNPNARVMGGTYANHNDPPLFTKLNKDVILRMTPPIMYPWTPEKVQENNSNWKGWADTGASMMFRPNFTLDGHNFPLMYYKFFAACYDFAAQHSLCAVDMDSYMGVIAANGMTNYVIATKTNQPERTVEELEDEYCAAFGKAKEIIREYVANFEAATAKGFVADNSGRIEGGNYAEFILDAPKVFTDDVMKRAFALLEKAEAADDDPVVRKRIAFLKTGLTDCQCTLDAQKAFEEYNQSGDPLPFAKAYKKLLEFRDANEGLLYQNRDYPEGFEGRLWPRHLLSLLNDDETELKNWQIRFDPENKGLEEQWYLDKSSEGWEPIILDDHWRDKPIGIRWKKEHGENYNGVGWYRTSFIAKDTSPNQKVELHFWAIDGLPIVYLNGEVVLAKHPVDDPRVAWQTPVFVDVTGKLKEGENTIAVRIDKVVGGPRGIYKYVFIKTGDAEPQAALPVPEQWKFSAEYGKFGKVASHSFPLTITGLEADPTTQRYKGIWSRFYQSIPVTPGSAYEVWSSFCTDKDFQGAVEFWLRAGEGNGLNEGNKNFSFLSTKGNAQKCKFRIKAARENCSVYLTLTKGTGTVQFLDLSITPILSIQQ